MLVQNCVKFPLIVTSRLLREEGEGRLFVRPHHRPMSALRPKSVSRKETGSEVVTATIYNREAALLFFFWSFSIFISWDPVGSVSLDRVTGQRRPESLRSGLDARSARWRPVPGRLPQVCATELGPGSRAKCSHPRQRTAQEGQRRTSIFAFF